MSFASNSCFDVKWKYFEIYEIIRFVKMKSHQFQSVSGTCLIVSHIFYI